MNGPWPFAVTRVILRLQVLHVDGASSASSKLRQLIVCSSFKDKKTMFNSSVVSILQNFGLIKYIYLWLFGIGREWPRSWQLTNWFWVMTHGNDLYVLLSIHLTSFIIYTQIKLLNTFNFQSNMPISMKKQQNMNFWKSKNILCSSRWMVWKNFAAAWIVILEWNLQKLYNRLCSAYTIQETNIGFPYGLSFVETKELSIFLCRIFLSFHRKHFLIHYGRIEVLSKQRVLPRHLVLLSSELSPQWLNRSHSSSDGIHRIVLQ